MTDPRNQLEADLARLLTFRADRPDDQWQIGVASGARGLFVARVPWYAHILEAFPDCRIYSRARPEGITFSAAAISKVQLPADTPPPPDASTTGATSPAAERSAAPPDEAAPLESTAELLRLYIMQCHARSDKLSPEEFNNLGYAYAALPEPDLEMAEWAFQKALQEATDQKVVETIRKNLKELRSWKLRMEAQSRERMPVRLPAGLLQQVSERSDDIVEGKVDKVRLMARDEIASLKM